MTISCSSARSRCSTGSMRRTRTRTRTPTEDPTDPGRECSPSLPFPGDPKRWNDRETMDKETPPMLQEIAPIAVRPWTLNGLSERLLVNHYEHHYGSAVRTLNAVRRELAHLDAGAPDYRIGALKRDELTAMGSVALHELYFGNLGGEGNKIPDPVAAILEEHFGSAWAWRREFVRAGQSLVNGSGWVALTYDRRAKRFWNQMSTDHAQA